MLTALRNDGPALSLDSASPVASKARVARKGMDDCATPMSQMSTAPPTPFHSWMLPDSSFPEGVRLTRSISEDSTPDAFFSLGLPDTRFSRSYSMESSVLESSEDDLEPVRSLGMVPLQSELGQRAQRIVAAQEWMERQLSSSSRELAVDDDSDSEDDTAPVRENVLSFGMPPLQSKLGQRAQRIVEAQEWMEKQLSSSSYEPVTDDAADTADREPVFSFGMPPLQSELGQWAQRIVEAQEWMEKQLSSSSSKPATAAADAREPVFSFGMPPLQSELGQRAQRIVEAQEWMERQLCCLSELVGEEDDLAPVVSFCLPPLQSELGQRAQRIVAAQEWMERQLASVCGPAKGADDDGAEPDYSTDVSTCFSVDSVDDLVEFAVSFGVPPLQSELGQRAQRIVAAKEWIDKQLSRAGDCAAEAA